MRKLTAMHRRTAVAAIAIALFASPLRAAPQLVTFEVPGADTTYVTGINNNGDISGFWVASSAFHGFLRSPDGAITSFDVPYGPNSTIATGINSKGTIVGAYAGDTFGFLRSPEGAFRRFRIPHGKDITYPSVINDDGWVAGIYLPHRNGFDQPFVRSPDGQVTEFTIPGTLGADIYGINASGAVTGDAGGLGFIRNLDGSIIRFGVQGAALTYPKSINASGVVVGVAQFANASKGFIRAANGIVSLIDVPSGTSKWGTGVYATGINASGRAIGSWESAIGGAKAFIRAADGTFTSFSVGQSGNMFPVGVNDDGVVAGSYEDAASHYVGFLYIP